MSVFVPLQVLLGGSVLTVEETWLPGYTQPQRVMVPAAAAIASVYPRDAVQIPDNLTPVFPNGDGTGVPLVQPLTADADGRFAGYVLQPIALDVALDGLNDAPRTVQVGTPFDPIGGTVNSSGLLSTQGILISGDPLGQTGGLLIIGTISGSGPPTSGDWPPQDIADEIAQNPLFVGVPIGVYDDDGQLQIQDSPGSPGVWRGGPAAIAPVVTSAFVDTITSTSAMLRGTINPGGVTTKFQFLFGTDATYGLQPVPVVLTVAGGGSVDVAVAVPVTGLTPGDEYHCQLVAVSPGGVDLSGDVIFDALPNPVSVPTVAAVGQSLVTQTTAKLTGTVVPNGAPTDYYFEYGSIGAYGAQTPALPGAAIGSGSGTVTVTANLTGLPPNAPLHWRLRAANSAGSAIPTPDQVFTTLNATAPTAVTQAATNVGNNVATLNGQCNPEGDAATYHFNMGIAPGVYSMPRVPVPDASVGFSDSTAHAVSQTTGPLAANTKYYFQLVTHTPSGGTTLGPELFFTTTNVLLPAQFSRFSYSPAGPLVLPPGGETARQLFSRYGIVVLQRSGNTATDQAWIAQIKQENPQAKVLVYQDALYYRSLSGGYIQDAILPATQNAHEDWFLHDQATGARIVSHYAGDYLMALGATDMQAFITAGVEAVVAASGFDGAFFDDVTANIAWGYTGGMFDSRFPIAGTPAVITPAGLAAWQAQVLYFLQHAVADLRASGMLVYANLGGTAQFSGLWQTWAALLDGAMEESLGDSGQGLGAGKYYVNAQLNNLAWSEANGKKVLCSTLNSTEAGQVYGLAMMMLVGNGHCYKVTQNNGAYTAESWYGASGLAGGNEYDKALLLGAPSGAMTGSITTGFMRLFSGGSGSNVKLNPTGAPLVIGGVSVPAYTGQINYVP